MSSRVAHEREEAGTPYESHEYSHHMNTDLMKIDVESAEHLVLVGGEATLDRDRPIIICEVLFGQFSPELEQQLSKRDYRFFLITDRGLQAMDHIEPDPRWRDLNFLLVPAEEVERLPEGLRDRILPSVNQAS